MAISNKPEKDPNPNTYPTGKKMKKGSRLPCMGCNPRNPNPNCKGCKGKGYIIV